MGAWWHPAPPQTYSVTCCLTSSYAYDASWNVSEFESVNRNESKSDDDDDDDDGDGV